MREIERAVRNSAKYAWQPTHGTAKPISLPRRVSPTAPPRPWPKPDSELQADILSDYGEHGGLAELLKLSDPRPMDDPEYETEFIIDALFKGNPWLCCGKSKVNCEARHREDWRGELAAQSFIVPSPMLKKYGETQDGKVSQRALESVGPRLYLGIEFDRHSINDQCAIHLHLRQLYPLVCALHSGNKSVHGWYLVHGQPESEVRSFFEYAVRLGADTATWTRHQLIRMPGGQRRGDRDETNKWGTVYHPSKRQMIYHLNFEPLNNKEYDSINI